MGKTVWVLCLGLSTLSFFSSVATLTAQQRRAPDSPQPLWTASLRTVGYESPSNPDPVFLDRDLGITITEHYVIVGFRLATELQRERPKNAAGSATVRLIALELSSGRAAWQKDEQVLWWPFSGPFLWAIRDVGFGIRTPDAVELYSEKGESLRMFPLPDSDISPSPSGHVVAVALPAHRARGDDERPRDLFALDVVSGKRLAAVRGIITSFLAGEREVVFSMPPEHTKKLRARSFHTEPRTSALFVASEDSPARQIAEMQVPFFQGSFVSPSRLVLLRHGEEPGKEFLSISSTRGKVFAERTFDGQIAVTAAAGRMAISHFRGNDEDIEVVDVSGPATTGTKKFLFGEGASWGDLMRLRLKSGSGEHAHVALSADASLLAVLSDGTVRLYALPASGARNGSAGDGKPRVP